MAMWNSFNEYYINFNISKAFAFVSKLIINKLIKLKLLYSTVICVKLVSIGVFLDLLN